MSSKFAKGDTALQIVKPIQGTVLGFQIDQESGDRLIQVGWSDADGDHSRFFKEDEISKVEQTPVV